MKSITACTLAALIALASGAALAQGASGIGAASSAGTQGNSLDRTAGSTGTAVGSGTPSTSSAVALKPAAPYVSNTSVSGNSASTISYHWNVPASAEADPDFKRWQRLR